MYSFRAMKDWGNGDEELTNGKRRSLMKAREVMTGTPYYCQPETNLGSATELMWNANCGFLPVETADGKVIGVVTDRDICIALGTRGRSSGDVTVAEVMSSKLCSCAPDDDIHVALQTLRDGRVRRLPVIGPDGSLIGVISIDDILLRAEPASLGKEPELSSDEVVRTFQAITQRQVPVVVRKQAAVG
jgi:CBS domain-containing protein